MMRDESVCCAPQRDAADVPGVAGEPVGSARADTAHPAMVDLPGGSFLMGTDRVWFGGDGEGPVREVVLHPFRIDAYAVSNQHYADFVADTGYVTDAERFEWSFVFGGFLPDDFPETRGVVGAEWWRQVEGASWRYPEGSHSSIEDRLDHPVVHVSWADAVAYAVWRGVRLPTDAEWEYAARGGLEQADFPWGDELEPDGAHRCNIWQGSFPEENTEADGFVGTAPVDSFEPNGLGLYNTSGNVWEWCSDWFDNRFPVERPLVNPQGPEAGQVRVMRGGSYLCHESYCNRYRVAARHASSPESSTGHLGFRCAQDL